MQIPKIIHQIWLQGEKNIPEDYPNYSESWKEKNPEFTYILWDDEMIKELINKTFPKFMDIYNNYPKLVQKVDSAKYIILYHYGGIYIDMDLECIKNLSGLVNKYNSPACECVLLKCDMGMLSKLFFYNTTNDIIQNCFAMSVPHFYLWHACVESMSNEDLNIAKYELLEKYIFRTTGPGLLTKVYHNLKDKKNIYLLDTHIIEPFTSCEYDYYECASKDCKNMLTDSYAIHHFGAKHGSHGWMSDNGKFVFQTFCNKKNLDDLYFYLGIFCIIIIILIIIFFLVIRYYNNE